MTKVIRTKIVAVKDVDVEDWKALTELAERCGLTMSQLVHVFAEAVRGRIGQGWRSWKGPVVRSIQEGNRQLADARRAHLKAVTDALFPEESPRKKQ